MKATKIKRITDSILELPPLPSIVSRIIESVDDPTTSATSLSKLIATDQALTAKILKIANSPFYAFRNNISSVKLAISLMGFDAISNLVLSISF
ncbi:MAG: HDOD domain-containing protein, partial [Candidatus Cloacimonadota bacterium]|nr:HDOD domain-containing protein [Candidatus Cloacimonadota bacterium]